MVLDTYASIIETLKAISEKEETTFEQRTVFAELMVEIADKMAETDNRNKEYLSRASDCFYVFTGLLALCAVALLGVKIKDIRFH